MSLHCTDYHHATGFGYVNESAFNSQLYTDQGAAGQSSRSHGSANTNVGREISLAGSSLARSYCYNVEVQRKRGKWSVEDEAMIGEDQTQDQSGGQGQTTMFGQIRDGIFGGGRDADTTITTWDPLHYCIVLHSPIRVENLLPVWGLFEIIPHSLRETQGNY